MEEEYKKLYNNGELELWCTSCKEVRKHTEYLDRRGGYLQGVICNECGENKQMRKPAYYDCYPYKEKCPNCGREVICLTQDNNSPEYGTSVGVICECKEVVWFLLPVN